MDLYLDPYILTRLHDTISPCQHATVRCGMVKIRSIVVDYDMIACKHLICFHSIYEAIDEIGKAVATIDKVHIDKKVSHRQKNVNFVPNGA